MMMNVEQSAECELTGDTKVFGENLPQCHFVHHKSHTTWPVFEPGPLGWDSSDYFFFNSHSGGWNPFWVHSARRPLLAFCTYPWWLWRWRILWNEDWQGKPKHSERTCPSATLSTTNPTSPDSGANPGRRGEKPATNRLSYGTAYQKLSRIATCYITTVSPNSVIRWNSSVSTVTVCGLVDWCLIPSRDIAYTCRHR
jgi:hypothetical protein